MNVSVYEDEKNKRLASNNIILETIYGNSKGKVRKSDCSVLDNIECKNIYEKKYYMNNKCVHIEKEFPNNIFYNIKRYSHGIEDKFIYSLIRVDKSNNIFSKIFSKTFFITFLIFLILTSLISKFFNLSFIFSIIISFIVSFVISKNKLESDPNYLFQKNYKKKITWDCSKNEDVFYSNLNTELLIYFLKKDKLIDYDILEISDIKFVSDNEILIDCVIRRVFFDDEIYSNINTFRVKMIYNKFTISDDYDFKCLGCGSSIDFLASICGNCNRINDLTNEWLLVGVERV